MAIPPFQEDDNTELVDSSEENSNHFDNLDDFCEYDCDPSLNFKVINSMKLEIVKIDRYEKIYEKIQKKFLSLSTNPSQSIWKYCQKYLSFNISFLLYTILDCIQQNSLIMIKICRMIKLMTQNYNHEKFISDFKNAVFTYRLQINNSNDTHILLFQILISTCVLSTKEAIIILQILFGEKKNIVDDKELFSEILNLPRYETIATNMKTSQMQKQLNDYKKILKEINSNSNSNSNSNQKQQEKNQIMEELILNNGRIHNYAI